jgi:hypothetical protein
MLWATALLLTAITATAGAVDPAPQRQLTRATLMQARTLAAPLNLMEFAAPDGAMPPAQRFTGRLSFHPRGDRTHSTVLHDRDRVASGKGRSMLGLPSFDFEFIQSGDALIPLRRGAQRGDSRYWEYILEPGRVWQEPGDRGLTRAAIPFALQERNANCLHYGVLSFLFGDPGTVSQVAFQVSGETCLYLKFDLWGLAEARYTPTSPPEAAAVASAWAEEVRARLPLRPIGKLHGDYPGADPAAFGSPAEVASEDMTAYGFVIDGVHYAGGCRMRHGLYPFCDVLGLPSYSLAKSLFAGVALMRLEQLFPGTAQEKIVDYVPECARAGGWDDITFVHALDMATGRFRSPELWADEHANFALELHLVESHARKIHHACTAFPRREAPGNRWVYRTADTYVLGTALSAFVKRRLGRKKDLYDDVVVADLWRPLGLSPVTAFTRRTYDAVAQPFTGWGLVLHRDDIARIARWLSSGDGTSTAQSLLDSRMLAEALQRVPGNRGLQAIDARTRYQHGFYGRDVGPDIGCAGPAWVPYMTGYGGIVVVLFPNGSVYYYVSDGDTFRWRRAAIESERIRSYCAGRQAKGIPS